MSDHSLKTIFAAFDRASPESWIGAFTLRNIIYIVLFGLAIWNEESIAAVLVYLHYRHDNDLFNIEKYLWEKLND